MLGRGKDEDPIEKGEMKRIQKRLDEGESIVMSVRQSRIKPGGAALINPNTIFLTEKRVIIRNPIRLGIGEHIEEYFYHQITNVRLEKGLFSSSLVFHIPGMTEMSKQNRKLRGGDGGMRIWGRENEGTIDAIPKKSAEKLYEYCREKVEEARKTPKTVEIAGASSPPHDDGDPLKILKARYARGEITEEEFERMRAKIE